MAYFQVGDKVKIVYPESFKNIWGFLPVVDEMETLTGEIFLPTSDYDVMHTIHWQDGSISNEPVEYLRLVENTI